MKKERLKASDIKDVDEKLENSIEDCKKVLSRNDLDPKVRKIIMKDLEVYEEYKQVRLEEKTGHKPLPISYEHSVTLQCSSCGEKMGYFAFKEESEMMQLYNLFMKDRIHSNCVQCAKNAQDVYQVDRKWK